MGVREGNVEHCQHTLCPVMVVRYLPSLLEPVGNAAYSIPLQRLCDLCTPALAKPLLALSWPFPLVYPCTCVNFAGTVPTIFTSATRGQTTRPHFEQYFLLILLPTAYCCHPQLSSRRCLQFSKLNSPRDLRNLYVVEGRTTSPPSLYVPA